MKKITVICMVILGAVALIACEPKNVKPNYEKQIVGKWEVKNYYHWYHDFTDESLSSEVSVDISSRISTSSAAGAARTSTLP